MSFLPGVLGDHAQCGGPCGIVESRIVDGTTWWRAYTPPCGGADFDGDGSIGLSDLLLVLENFGCPFTLDDQYSVLSQFGRTLEPCGDSGWTTAVDIEVGDHVIRGVWVRGLRTSGGLVSDPIPVQVE